MKDHSPCFQLSRTVMGEHVPLDNLRLELSPTCFYILPYHHVEVAKFESGDTGDTLSISFLKHQARIAGRNLRRLAVGVQGRAVEWLKPVPERYAAAAGIEACFVVSIEVEHQVERIQDGRSA